MNSIDSSNMAIPRPEFVCNTHDDKETSSTSRNTYILLQIITNTHLISNVHRNSKCEEMNLNSKIIIVNIFTMYLLNL